MTPAPKPAPQVKRQPSGLVRKTRLTPGGPLRHQSVKRAAAAQESGQPVRIPLQRSERLPVQSPKRRKEQAERSKVLRVLFPDPVVCAVPDCSSEATDPHEPLTRGRGGSITDPNNIVGLCRRHHDAIHSEPAWAYELGLLRHSWDNDSRGNQS